MMKALANLRQGVLLAGCCDWGHVLDSHVRGQSDTADHEAAFVPEGSGVMRAGKGGKHGTALAAVKISIGIDVGIYIPKSCKDYSYVEPRQRYLQSRAGAPSSSLSLRTEPLPSTSSEQASPAQGSGISSSGHQ